jgi:hypothetical protein
LHVALPARYRVQPGWVVPAGLLVPLAVLTARDPGRIDRQKTWLRILTGILIAVITLANLLAAGRLVVDILTSNKLYANQRDGTAGRRWRDLGDERDRLCPVVLGLDRGGAAARAHPPARPPTFVFPEMQNLGYVPATWVPRFIDYLFLAFWTATTASPTDTVAIKPWAKLLMMLEATGSIALTALVIARAINILK